MNHEILDLRDKSSQIARCYTTMLHISITSLRRFYAVPERRGMETYQKSGLKTGCFDVNYYNQNITTQPSQDILNSNVTGTKYTMNGNETCNSTVSCNEKTVESGEKSLRKQSCAAEVRLFKRRFLMLFLFAMCSMMNGFPQFQYTVVADIVSCYYRTSLNDINWTCVVYMVVFLPLVFPVMYLMDKKGLKVTLIIGAVLNCLGSWVQCFSFAPDRYIVIMACQTIYAFGQVFVISLPPFIAGVWFGAAEVGLACAMGVFGNQLGIALGFIIPPSMMTNDCTDKTETDYGKSLKKLFCDTPFVLLLLGYGLLTGTYFAMSTIMNEMVLIHFPGEEIDAGWMGAIMVFAGMIGSIILGALLDKTHKFKSISLVMFVLSFFIMVGYTFLIQLERIWIQFLFFTLLGFIMTGYLPAGFDFGAEITYPEPEAMSASLLNTSTQVRKFKVWFEDEISHDSCCCLVIMLTIFLTKNELRFR
ncbi:feline leukemia virus subgroup C receptor-related protein 1 [Trichonephila inaurata madagascariensis]|uniref:Feline leukemia virus subgroup C receptor-related protein 1 n=1 Tax=Trichonephila inaurata madagascariensis TaxID=2747483 RepID=A0A8X7CLS9_9ARAC|nr:feline leukemia virus subgroup C receptor-related protein 1 [Trichonephila inaurata madagascariensis]